MLQLAIYLGIGFWRHWFDYQTLRSRVAQGELAVASDLSAQADTPGVAAWPGWRAFRVSRKIIENSVGDICSFYLTPQDGQTLAPYLPGQYLTFRLETPGTKEHHAPTIRCYSLSQAPGPDAYRVTIKRTPVPADGGCTPGSASNFFHDQVHVGSTLQVRAPAGHFHIDHGQAPVVLMGGGIGITPMLSMLTWSLAAQAGREIWLFYGARHSGELVEQERLRSLATQYPNFHLHICLSKPKAGDVLGQNHQQVGRIDVDLLRRLLPLKPYHFYICGPTPLLESLVPALEDWGVPGPNIHFEAFGPASVKRKNSVSWVSDDSNVQAIAGAVTVNFARSNKQLPWQSDCGNLLDWAQSHGIAVDSGCRAGGCGSCQTTITSGEVSYRQAPDFDPEPGTCLLCVCTPKTNVTLEL